MAASPPSQLDRAIHLLSSQTTQLTNLLGEHVHIIARGAADEGVKTKDELAVLRHCVETQQTQIQDIGLGFGARSTGVAF